MAEAVIRTPLLPIDAEKGYPQWGRLKDPSKPSTQDNIEWTVPRQTDSRFFRETHGNFEQAAVYEIAFMYPGYPEPFTSTATGAQLGPLDANGFPTERQSNYPFASIGQLPTYTKLTNSVP